MNTSSIRSHLLLLVLAVSIPLTAAVGFAIYVDFQQSIAGSKRALRTLASTMVSNTGGRIASARQMLERLAARPLVMQVDAAQCDPLLKDIHALDPAYANTVYSNLDGLVICSALTRPDNKPVNASPMLWYQEFRKAGKFSVGRPHFGPISKKWVSVLSAPINNERQEMVGSVHLSLDLKNYDPHIPDQFLPEGSRYGFFSDDGFMIWRNLDPEGVIGTRPNAEAARRIVEIRDGEFQSLAVDGVTRFFSVMPMPMPETGWVAFVGVPADSVFAAARQRAITASLIALFTLGALLLLAVAIARRISRPIAALERIAHAVHEGHTGTRVAPSGPREVFAVAQAFNTMLDTQQRNEAQLRAFLDNSAIIAWLKDGDGRHVFVSDNFLKRFALSRDAVIGKTDAELWPTEMAKALRCNDLEMLDRGRGIEVVEAVPDSDGKVTWWLSSKFVFQDATGGRFLGGVAVDISERQQLEDQLRKLAQAVEQSSVGIVITNLAAEIEYVNESFVRTSGRSREELIGRNLRILQSGKTPPATYTALWGSLVNGRNWNGELINRRKDGSEYVLASNITPLRQPDGHITHYVGSAEDITEKQRIAAELDQHRHHLEEQVVLRTRELQLAKVQAESANQAKSVFLSNMSHELRTPLNAVIGFSQLMTRSSGLGEAEKRNLEIINRSGKHLLTLINDVLELSKIDAGRVELFETEFELTTLLADVIAMLEQRAEQAGLTLRLETQGMLGGIRTDEVKLRQILINLLGNAIKFTQTGGVTLSVTGTTATAGRVLLAFAIRDTGIGIAEADQQKIFEPFTQMVTHATTAGSGLGLTITRQYLTMLGGELSVTSTPGQGSTFHFCLDVPAVGVQAPSAAVCGVVTKLAAADQGKSILVVEDNPDARILLTALLEPLGFAVSEAEDGAVAVAILEQDGQAVPDLILMDWRMPNMDGLEASRRIRALPLAKQPKIVMLTATAFAEQRQEALDAGADDYLRKPVDEEELYAALETQLGIRLERASQEISAASPAPSFAADVSALTPAALAVLPSTLRSDLRQAAVELNRAKLDAALAVLASEHQQLARTLAHMADTYRYQDMLKALDEVDADD